ncbi:MAG TPA: hypothetical protein DCX17_00880 [Firmicutes bacterium]|nr:hypothetical protein [Bacillota bacterium]
MKAGLIAVFIIINYAIVGPIEPDDPIRQFINVFAPPYSGATAIEIPFTFESSIRESVTIEILFENDTYARQIIYTRSLDNIISFSSQVTIPSFLLHEEKCLLWLNARNSTFGISRPVALFHTTELKITEFQSEGLTHAVIANINYIDDESVSHLIEEEIWFEGFIATIETAYYGYLTLDNLRINLINPGNQPINFFNFTLRLGDTNHHFPLLRRSIDDAYVLLNLRPIYSIDGYMLVIDETMYVHPTTFIMSDALIEGFVPSNRLYFPKDRFHELQTTFFIIEGEVTMYNTFSFTYKGLYYFNQALIGPCSHSVYCVTTSDEQKSIGAYEETIIIHG